MLNPIQIEQNIDSFGEAYLSKPLLKMKFYRHTGRFLVILLIPALCWIFYNHAANWHFHVLANGMIIEHAHPYDKASDPESPIANHSHTNSDLLFFDIISQVLFLVVAAYFLSKIYRTLISRPKPTSWRLIVCADPGQIKEYRGPPSCLA